MIEFSNHIYAGAPPQSPPTIIKHISQKWLSQTTVSMSPANLALVILSEKIITTRNMI